MSKIVKEIETLGIDVINPKEIDGELVFKSRALDRLGPSVINDMLFKAFDAGKLSIDPFSIFVARA